MNPYRYRRLLVWLSCLIIGAACAPASVQAGVMYPTYTKDNFDSVIFTQPVYTPVKILGKDLVAPDPNHPGTIIFSPLRSPGDMYVDAKDHLYVADSGNNRIVHFDEQLNFVRYIALPDDPFSNPQGVFVNKEGQIFVADTGKKRIVQLDAQGNLLRVFDKPQSRYVPQDLKFDPIKLVADRRGYLYVVTLGGYRGLIQMDSQGSFQSFYGANLTPFTLLDATKRMFYTRAMYANEMSKLPPSINNIALDKDGFVFTVTASTPDNPVKRLDMRGENLLQQPVTGEYVKKIWQEGKALQPTLVDVAIDRYGNIATIDSRYNYVSHYDPYGNLMYFWGGRSSSSSAQMGMIKNPAAIDFNSQNMLFVLDDQEGVVQAFALSEFGALINQANQLTINGYYEESAQYWHEVLQLNSRYAPAIEGIAKAAYKKEQYREALTLFRIAGDQMGYSDAYWQLRLIWFQEKFSFFATLFIVLSVGYLLFNGRVRRWLKRWQWSDFGISRLEIANQLKHAFYLLKHPVDGFAAIRYENKGGYASAASLLLIMGVALVFNKQFTSFSFNHTTGQAVNIAAILTKFILIWLGMIVCNYLISSIYRGDGRFRDVFIGSAYALLPYILFSMPLAVLSNVLTRSEETIYNYLLYGIYVWTAAMFFWMVQNVQNYGVGETFVNIFLSLFAFVALGVLGFIIFGLSNELSVFVNEVYKEVSLR